MADAIRTLSDQPKPPERPVRGRELSAWPVVIGDAPIRCGKCDEVICGSGKGPLGTLSAIVGAHGRVCRKRFGQEQEGPDGGA